MAILVSDATLPALLGAVAAGEGSEAGGAEEPRWRVAEQRRFALTDETTGVVVVLWQLPPGEAVESAGRLAWEGPDAPAGLRQVRGHWAELRARSSPGLAPVSA